MQTMSTTAPVATAPAIRPILRGWAVEMIEHGEEIRDGLWPSISTRSYHGFRREKDNVPILWHNYLLIERQVVVHSKDS